MRCIILAEKVEEQTRGGMTMNVSISNEAVVSDGEVRAAMVCGIGISPSLARRKRDSGMQVNDSLTLPGLDSVVKGRQLSAAGRALGDGDRSPSGLCFFVLYRSRRVADWQRAEFGEMQFDCIAEAAFGTKTTSGVREWEPVKGEHVWLALTVVF